MPEIFQEFRRHFLSRKKIRRFFKVRAMRWWLKHPWRIKTHVLILITAVLLITVSLWGYLFYRSEVYKISERFLRLQVFAPPTVFSLPVTENMSAESAEKQKTAEALTSRFHLETRSPAGNPISDAKIELLLKHPDGTPFFSHSEKTDIQGCLDLRLPNSVKLPPQVSFQITAVHGKKEDSCVGSFEVMPRPFTFFEPLPPEPLTEIFSRKDESSQRALLAKLGPPPDDWSRDVFSVPFLMRPMKKESSPFPRMEIPQENVVSRAGTPQKIILHGEKPGVPMIVGVWCRDFLVGFRPKVVSGATREVEIPIPETFTGLLMVTLHVYGKTPPEMADSAFIFRTADKIPDGISVNEELKDVFHQMSEKEALRKNLRGNRVEFMSPELASPPDYAELGENVAKTLNTEASEENSAAAEHHRRLHAVSRILLTAMDWDLRKWDSEEEIPAAETFPSETLRDLESAITQVLAGGENEPAGHLEDRKTLVRNALAVQTEVMRENLRINFPAGMRKVPRQVWREFPELSHAPLVYDGMETLEERYREDLRHFQDRVFRGLGGIVGLILCLAGGLILLVAMMSILNIPTGWNVWGTTLLVVGGAMILALLIFSKSDLRSDTRNVIFHRWMTELPAAEDNRL